MSGSQRRVSERESKGADVHSETASGSRMRTPLLKAVLSDAERAELRRWDTPTIANALEKLNSCDRLDGCMNPAIRCIFPELGITNGYAGTATIRASRPRASGYPAVSNLEYWEYISSLPKPTFMVIHDLDAPHPVGSFWGEVNANVHRALGCIGVVTDGGVRDLPVVRPLGFHFFAAEILVSHAYVHLVDFGKPVKVGGVTIHSGDLVQADEHGVIQIPREVATETVQACYEVFLSERELIQFCQQPDMTFEKLKAFVQSR